MTAPHWHVTVDLCCSDRNRIFWRPSIQVMMDSGVEELGTKALAKNGGNLLPPHHGLAFPAPGLSPSSVEVTSFTTDPQGARSALRLRSGLILHSGSNPTHGCKATSAKRQATAK